MSTPLQGGFAVKKSQSIEEQMVGILREADREPVAPVAKKYGISEQTIYTWRQRFGGMSADEVKHLQPLEQENARLKKLLAERDLEIEEKKEVAAKMVSAPARRQLAAFALRRGVSQRKACALFSWARSAPCYESRMVLRDAPLMALMRTLAARYPRYGYRRIAGFREREGHKMGPDKAYRLWCAAGPQVPRKRPRKGVAASRPRPGAPSFTNEVWSDAFVYDACANGQQVKRLTVVDEFTRESLAIDVAGSIRSG